MNIPSPALNQLYSLHNVSQPDVSLIESQKSNQNDLPSEEERNPIHVISQSTLANQNTVSSLQLTDLNARDINATLHVSQDSFSHHALDPESVQIKSYIDLFDSCGNDSSKFLEKKPQGLSVRQVQNVTEAILKNEIEAFHLVIDKVKQESKSVSTALLNLKLLGVIKNSACGGRLLAKQKLKKIHQKVYQNNLQIYFKLISQEVHFEDENFLDKLGRIFQSKLAQLTDQEIANHEKYSGKEGYASFCPNFFSISQISTNITNMAMAVILSKKKDKAVAKAIAMIVKAGHYCLEKHNVATAAALKGSLSKDSIYRLNKCRQSMSSIKQAAEQQLNDYFEKRKISKYDAYRKELMRPYINVTNRYLKWIIAPVLVPFISPLLTLPASKENLRMHKTQVEQSLDTYLDTLTKLKAQRFSHKCVLELKFNRPHDFKNQYERLKEKEKQGGDNSTRVIPHLDFFHSTSLLAKHELTQKREELEREIATLDLQINHIKLKKQKAKILNEINSIDVSTNSNSNDSDPNLIHDLQRVKEEIKKLNLEIFNSRLSGWKSEYVDLLDYKGKYKKTMQKNQEEYQEVIEQLKMITNQSQQAISQIQLVPEEIEKVVNWNKLNGNVAEDTWEDWTYMRSLYLEPVA